MAPILFLVKLAIARLTVSQFIEKARAIVTAMTGNADFPTPVPTLASIETLIDKLEAAETDVLNNGGKQDYVVRNMFRDELRTELTLLASYVQVTSGGDRVKILSAGFETRRLPAPVGIPDKPANLRITLGELPGSLQLRWGRVRGRLNYKAQYCEGDPLVEANWKDLVELGRNYYVATDLEGGKSYSFRVRALGAAGYGPYSDVAVAKPL